MTFIESFSLTWHSLPWSPWIPFTADRNEFRLIPKSPGLYRIRPAGKNFLMYIGETGRSLRERLNDLCRNTLKDLMPWNDPHTAAPSLWAWRHAEGFSYECSAAPFEASQHMRRGMESFLLYRYRLENRESTLCNFGRFHKRYRKSTNKKKNFRGGKLDDAQKDNPAGGPSLPPLLVTGKPGDSDWMGLRWSERKLLDIPNIQNVPARSGFYLLFNAISREVVYIGQSANCSQRLKDHSRKIGNGIELQFSVHILQTLVFPHNLKEWESDLIGNFFENHRKAPRYQFGNTQ